MPSERLTIRSRESKKSKESKAICLSIDTRAWYCPVVSTKETSSIINIRSYRELERFVIAFASGQINLLVIVGDAGLQKSRTVREHVSGESCWIQGNASPFGIYLKLYRHLDQLVVIDDVDGLSRNRHGVNLLKCLCQTEVEKTIAWLSATRQLNAEGVPREFVTASRVCIIANDWNLTGNKDLRAVEDRGHIIRFAPTAMEIHVRCKEWFDDPEIYEWIGRRLDRIPRPSMRLYFRAKELKAAGLDWQNLLALSPIDVRRQLVADLLVDKRYSTQAERVSKFVERGGGCRATYFNHLRRLRFDEA